MDEMRDAPIRKPIIRLWIPAACLFLLVLAGLACALPSGGDDDSMQKTQIALDVQATTLALREAQLTQDAAAPGEAPPPATPTDTVAPPPTTEPPPPAATPTDTVEPPPEEGEPVEGSLVRAPYDPAYDWGSGHDSEDFDGTKGIFPSSSAGAATAYYDDGRYNITFTSRGRWTWYWTFLDPRNFYADVVIFNGDKCDSRDAGGMVFRGDSVWDYGYMFGITCGGEYVIAITAIPGTEGIVWSIDGNQVLIGELVYLDSDLIDTGPGAVNRVGVMAKNGDFDLYINGKWVDEFGYWGFPPSAKWDQGNMALFLGTGNTKDAAVSFDDFNVWNLP
jgi:hypothetical protein